MCDNCGSNYNVSTHIPYYLPCGHSICKMCLDEIWEKSFNIRCPLDNYEKLGHKKYIPKNEYIISLLNHDIIPERSKFDKLFYR